MFRMLGSEVEGSLKGSLNVFSKQIRPQQQDIAKKLNALGIYWMSTRGGGKVLPSWNTGLFVHVYLRYVTYVTQR